MALLLGTILEYIQMVKRSIQGKPVLPMIIRKVPSTRGHIASWKETIESGVSVKPRSLNKEAEVKKPHQVGSTPTSLTTLL
jgi:hypothetical protein